jgi:hypothetical protein
MKEDLMTLPFIGVEISGYLECEKVEVELIPYENDSTIIGIQLKYQHSQMLIQKSALI